MSKFLVPQDRRLRWFELFFRLGFAGEEADPTEAPALRKAIERKSWAQEISVAFLERLPKGDRSLWRRLMLNRDGLVSAADGLPVVLLHGDLVPRNVGVRRTPTEKTIVLIDWELAGVGNAAFDVVHFLGHPFREISDRFELVDYYYERYLSHGGQDMDVMR